MINLYRKESQHRNNNKNRSLYTYHKSHTASMNLKIPNDQPLETTYRDALKHSYRHNEDDRKSRSTHKYKKSLVLQDTTIQLVKKGSQYYGGKPNNMGLSTQRLSKDKLHKRSVDYSANRIKTQMDQTKHRVDSTLVEVNADELKEMVRKLQQLKSQKQNLRKELQVYKRETKKSKVNNSVLKALAC